MKNDHGLISNMKMYNVILSKAFKGNSGVDVDRCFCFRCCYSVSDAKQKNFLLWYEKIIIKNTSFSLASVSESNKMYYAL